MKTMLSNANPELLQQQLQGFESLANGHVAVDGAPAALRCSFAPEEATKIRIDGIPMLMPRFPKTENDRPRVCHRGVYMD